MTTKLTIFLFFINNLIKMLTKAFETIMQAFLTAILGSLVAIAFIIPWFFRVGALLVFTYGLYEITLAVNEIYALFTDAVPLLALNAFVGGVQLSLFFVISAFDLRLVWGAIYLSGIISLHIAKHELVYILANWQHAALFFHALPPLLFITLVLTETLKAARKRAGGQGISLSTKFSGVVHDALDRIESIALPEGGDAP